MNITKKHEYYFGFFIICLLISFYFTAGCQTDDYYNDYDSDPLRGGGSFICIEDISWLQVFTRAVGFYIFGFMAHYFIEVAQKEDNNTRL